VLKKQCKDITLFFNIEHLFVKINKKNIIQIKFNNFLVGKWWGGVVF
jgi:hypothetical protein